MKTNLSTKTVTRAVILLLVALLGLALTAKAEDSGAPVPETKHRSFTGSIRTVDARERTITVESFLMTKSFATGDHCRVQLDDKPVASLNDLLPGQRVEVKYLTTDGVNVASRIVQENSAFTGHVSSLDVTGKVIKVKQGLATRAFKISDSCKFNLREENGQGLAGLKIGHKVTVRYAPTLQQNVAFKIELNSRVVTGTIEALDAKSGTLKTRQTLAGKTFKFGEDCVIVIDGKVGAKIRDLRGGDKITCHYEDVDGVLVANRISLDGPAAPAADLNRPVRTEAMRASDSPVEAR
jgi:Cu/Ag efflux protein CusF